MSPKDLICLCLVLVGIVLFLYGANYFDAVTGWVGVLMILAGVFGEIVLKLYEATGKKRGRLVVVEV